VAGIPVVVVPSELPVEPAPGMVLLTTLAGVDVATLAGIAAQLRQI
jgi:hypothetical protein